jgi:NMD protein affecting ribosome stability and mRNA decay
MSLFSAAMKMCDDCDRNDVPLSWSRDGNTKICADCKAKRGEREIGPRSARSHESEALEASLRNR